MDLKVRGDGDVAAVGPGRLPPAARSRRGGHSGPRVLAARDPAPHRTGCPAPSADPSPALTSAKN